jgi:hypothetical protein
MNNPWVALSYDMARLSFDAHHVVALRMMRFAAGGAAGKAEAHRMVTEKMIAFAELQAETAKSFALGYTPDVAFKQVIRIYGKRVRANRRRLSPANT